MPGRRRQWRWRRHGGALPWRWWRRRRRSGRELMSCMTLPLPPTTSELVRAASVTSCASVTPATSWISGACVASRASRASITSGASVMASGARGQPRLCGAVLVVRGGGDRDGRHERRAGAGAGLGRRCGRHHSLLPAVLMGSRQGRGWRRVPCNASGRVSAAAAAAEGACTPTRSPVPGGGSVSSGTSSATGTAWRGACCAAAWWACVGNPG